MAQSINLVPQQEVFEQKKSKVVRFSTIFSIFLLLAVGGISYFLISQKTKLEDERDSLNQDVEQLRADIQDLASIEITARTLDKRYSVLSEIVYNRLNYSELMDELKVRVPENIQLYTISRKENELNVTGMGNDYLSISKFTNNLVNSQFEGSDDKLQSLFTSAVLRSVSLSSKEGKVDFALSVVFDEELLKR